MVKRPNPKANPVGKDYYVSKGFKKPITVYVNEPTHKALMKEALEDERSLQTVVRRILEAHLTKTK